MKNSQFQIKLNSDLQAGIWFGSMALSLIVTLPMSVPDPWMLFQGSALVRHLKRVLKSKLYVLDFYDSLNFLIEKIGYLHVSFNFSFNFKIFAHMEGAQKDPIMTINLGLN